MRRPWLPLPHHRQEREYTCTPACVRMVLDFFGQSMQEEDIARLLETNENGTVFSRIRNVEPLGFDASVSQGTYQDIQQHFAQGLPVIVPVDTFFLTTYGPVHSPHSVVVVGATRTRTAIADPYKNGAPDVIPAVSFQAAWREGRHRMAVLRPR